jgi:hypothetical protein
VHYGGVTVTPIKRTLVAAGVLAFAVAAAGCSAQPAALQAKERQLPVKTRASGVRWAAVAKRAVPPASPARITYSQVKTADGSVITIATFHGDVQFVLHNGSDDPGKLITGVQAGPKIGKAERGRLLAAFNGGFKMAARDGGYEQEGRVAKPVRRGLASLVIDASGQARIGVWGQGVPVAGESVYSVRQNLWLLLANGKPTPESALWWRWGGTLGHLESVARSALGENAAGELMYAASMSTTPADLAQALAKAGARTGMELDINPEWVQMDAASKPGGPLVAQVPGQHRPADQYLTGWTRDFVTVLVP